ncbi:MAG TPA: hypothetical protein DCE30_12890 [Pantoea sp.]|nr:hypothetical protein [Pantoea sp.]
MERRAKRPAPGTKTPGAFLNNAARWPGNGRTSGMRCVATRAERAGMRLATLRSLHATRVNAAPTDGDVFYPFFCAASSASRTITSTDCAIILSEANSCLP